MLTSIAVFGFLVIVYGLIGLFVLFL